MSLLQAWARRRSVGRAVAFVLAVAGVVLAGCGWRIVADGSTVPVSTLASGPRHLLAPLVVLVVLSAAVAGAVASSDAASGTAAVLATTAASVRRGVLAQVAASALGAGAMVAVLGAAVALAAAGLVHQVGAGPGPTLAVMGDLALLVARAAVAGVGLGALSAALGLALPGSPVASMASSVGVAIVEAAAIPLSGGRLDLVGSSIAIAIAGPPQAAHLGLEPAGAAWIAGVVAVAPAAIAAALAVATVRFRPLPS